MVASNLVKQFKKILIANRGETVVRILRACNEGYYKSVAIFSEQDQYQMFRTKADESYLVGNKENPGQAYLDKKKIIEIAKNSNVDAIHPGIGFLAERFDFAQDVNDAGLVFIGPSPKVLKQMGDKVEARRCAIEAGVPVVPGTSGPVETPVEAKEFVEKHGLPVILKAAFGGGGRGMRVVRKMEELEPSFERASSEAKAAFGNGSMFIEKFIERPKHIEVQILGDSAGNIIHLYERDCSVQRRHQKVVSVAPAPSLNPKVRENMLNDALKLAKHVGYVNAGTVEYLVDGDKHYFIEVNARLQVEHPLTEQITGVDIVLSQIKIAESMTLPELELTQNKIFTSGVAIQCAITTEDPEKGFKPDSGRIEEFSSTGGPGIRLDGTAMYTGAVITPYYDSLLTKIISHSSNFRTSYTRLARSLREIRVKGVKTNIQFLLNVLDSEKFKNGQVDTYFIDDDPELFSIKASQNRAQKMMTYLGNVMVNGPNEPLLTKWKPVKIKVHVPEPPVGAEPPEGLRKIYKEKGPEAFAKTVKEKQELLLMDTTMRDAHQSLLAARVRTKDLLKISPFVAHNLHNLYAVENWGGATFEVALRYLYECPWERLEQMRQLIPNIPFQMALRGANIVGYKNYPDNVLFKFCEQAVKSGIDIFRIFDALNYMPNVKIAMEAVGKAGGIVEATIAYTGDVYDPLKTKYDLKYYLDQAGQLIKGGTHVLGIKDMAGLLTPQAGKMLISALKDKYPDIPIHVHSHAGLESMLACAEAGADIVDVAVDSMSGMTSQPPFGKLVKALQGSILETNFKLDCIYKYADYWEQTRMLYAPFECPIKSINADVYSNEIPAFQYTNFLSESFSEGLGPKFWLFKKAYKDANNVLGDIIKVTPTSKVVYEMAKFMLDHNLTEVDVQEKASELTFPQSVYEYLQGNMGQPYKGFPEPFRTKALKNLPTVAERPGSLLKKFEFKKNHEILMKKFKNITSKDVISAAIYPAEMDNFLNFRQKFGPVDKFETTEFFFGPQPREKIQIHLEKGRSFIIELTAVSDASPRTGEKEVFFEVNGQPRSIFICDNEMAKNIKKHPKANPNVLGEIGSPMPGSISEIKIKVGDDVKKGQVLIIISAMKMETAVHSPTNGKIKSILVAKGSAVKLNDLLLQITPLE